MRGVGVGGREREREREREIIPAITVEKKVVIAPKRCGEGSRNTYFARWPPHFWS